MSLKLWSAPSKVGSYWNIWFPLLNLSYIFPWAVFWRHLSPPRVPPSQAQMKVMASFGHFEASQVYLCIQILCQAGTVDWSVTSQYFPWSYWLSTHQKQLIEMKKRFNYRLFSPSLKFIWGAPFFHRLTDPPNLVKTWWIVSKQLWALKDIKFNCFFLAFVDSCRWLAHVQY